CFYRSVPTGPRQRSNRQSFGQQTAIVRTAGIGPNARGVFGDVRKQTCSRSGGEMRSNRIDRLLLLPILAVAAAASLFGGCGTKENVGAEGTTLASVVSWVATCL